MKTLLLTAVLVLIGLTATAQIAAVATVAPAPATDEQISLAVELIYEAFPETSCYEVVEQTDATLVQGVDQDGAVLTTVTITEGIVRHPCPPHCD